MNYYNNTDYKDYKEATARKIHKIHIILVQKRKKDSEFKLIRKNGFRTIYHTELS